jgi:SAM-dependent methyltransferase
VFTVPAEAYDRFMGRYSRPLAPRFADFAGVDLGERVLEVGCGPGALTGELVRRLGPASVVAVEPSETFVAAARERNPGVEINQAAAEDLPLGDDGFDASLAQLVVHFMSDPVKGLGEMARVTRPGGVVAACVWDHGGGKGPLSRFWAAARELDPGVDDESQRAGAREGHLAALMREAGVGDVAEAALTVSVQHASFDEWWEPFTLGVGPAGAFVAGLAPERRERLRERCKETFPHDLTVVAVAWAARGRIS